MITVGIDEVGRGCWAGPLVASAVVLDHNFAISKEPPWKLGDSKRLTRRQRERADAEIRRQALGYGLGWVTPGEIDTLGLTASVRLAYQRALQQIAFEPEEIIIDGNYNFLPDMPHARAVIRADCLVPSVSAASIIAKVARDAFMREAASAYPGYGFERHVGYGTSMHLTALRTLGVCQLHRRSFRPVRTIMELA